MDGYSIKRVGLREMAMKGGTALGVVRQEQPDAQGHHWSLFVAEEGKRGTVYQVTGDHTFMVYTHRPEVNILNSRTFRDIHQIAELDEPKVQRVVYWVNQEPPPRAPTQAQVRETCQSWTMRVVRRLIAEGIVAPKWEQELENLIDSPVLLSLRGR
ncbi:hypothetical protein ACJ73_07537 [Blastomyces percursus]|uniref:Uncharacterized protein n=1 Tax=Blastomyces percursus TaxID=1658174 RepID=A0A1J9PXR7_9EURO|nr:hypothetical protein ACJ73_07537 [Blastomyces percursus]